MSCWRCGRIEHAEWCSMPGGCDHCGWEPHRWWCLGPDREFSGLNPGRTYPGWKHSWSVMRIPEPG